MCNVYTPADFARPASDFDCTAYRDKLTVNSAVRGATRVIANAGTSVDADYQGLLTLRGALGSIPQVHVDRVVVFKADVNGNPTNPNCLLPAAQAVHGYVNDCNVHSASEIFTASASSFTSCAGGLHANFCPTTRVRPMSGALAPTDIGVWLGQVRVADQPVPLCPDDDDRQGRHATRTGSGVNMCRRHRIAPRHHRGVFGRRELGYVAILTLFTRRLERERPLHRHDHR
ncbi:MAG TPA: hypothetical protein VM282_01510 [Acidimicrobiales bacterium]|nr:hypothetical protein [Acidimicrobiales bacterium]